MTVTDEMVEAAVATLFSMTHFGPEDAAQIREDVRSALEAALSASPSCPYIRSTAEGTHHCALAADPADHTLREALK